MTHTLKDKNILYGVTGSIAAFKAASVVRLLRKSGANVRTIMTESAQKLITAETFRALTGNPVYTELFVESSQHSLEHISLAEWGQALIIAPATANVIGKAACGIADDLLSTLFLVCTCPVGFSPAMNDNMYAHPVVQRNVAALKQLGYDFLEPAEGELASGKVGRGRMPEPETVFNWAIEVVKRGQQTDLELI